MVAEEPRPDFPSTSHQGVAVCHYEVVDHEVVSQPQDVADEPAVSMLESRRRGTLWEHTHMTFELQGEGEGGWGNGGEGTEAP